VSTARAKLLVRALEAHVSDEWDAHPLRWHGLAEAYLLYGQGVSQAGRGLPHGDELNAPFERAVSLYEKVVSAASPLAPPLLRSSAKNNLGNAYYYLGDNERALAAWRDANSQTLGRRNLGSWGNIVAALILLGRPKEAIEEGEKAREWAVTTGAALVDSYQYSGIVGNMAFAKMQVGDVAGSLDDFATTNALQDDDLTKQNLAIALAINNKYPEAQATLRQLAPPAQPEDESAIVSKGNVVNCVYLIWALASPNAGDAQRAANLLAFLGEANSSKEIQDFAGEKLAALESRVVEKLPNSSPPCGTLGKIDAVVSLLNSKK
jgi:tetratricopeptide (TPR) repeat protein